MYFNTLVLKTQIAEQLSSSQNWWLALSSSYNFQVLNFNSSATTICDHNNTDLSRQNESDRKLCLFSAFYQNQTIEYVQSKHSK